MSGFIKFINDPLRNPNEKKRSVLQAQRLMLEKSIKKIEEDIKAALLQKQKVELNIAQKKEELQLVDLQKDRLARKIERVDADVKMTTKEISLLGEKIKIAEETRVNYEKSRREIDENTTRIIALRDKLLQSPPDDSLQLLLLGSTIQQNIAYLGTIEQKIEAARKAVVAYRREKANFEKQLEKSHLAIADLQDDIKREIPKKKSDIQKLIAKLQMTVEKEIPSKIVLLNQRIDGIKDKINTISILEVVEPPQASIKPEKPKKRKIVALAGIMGLFLAIIFAYLRHFWLANKEKLMA